MLGVRLSSDGVNNYYYYYHYDALGNVTAVTNSSGAVYRQYVYDPYGNIISVKDGSGNSVDITNDSGFNNAYTYRGYRYDSESGLYFLQSRYYAAGIGRFLTKDSVLGTQKDPQTLNGYAYCGGNPVNHIDPNGHFFFLIPLLGEEVVAALIVLTGELVAAIGEAAPAIVDDGAGDVNAVEGAISGAGAAGESAVSEEITSNTTNYHQHHTIPREIQKQLPEKIRTNRNIIGKRGLPNKVPVQTRRHLLEIHKGPGGGIYNESFKEEIENRGGFDAVDVNDVLEIRDKLVDKFNLK